MHRFKEPPLMKGSQWSVFWLGMCYPNRAAVYSLAHSCSLWVNAKRTQTCVVIPLIYSTQYLELHHPGTINGVMKSEMCCGSHLDIYSLKPKCACVCVCVCVRACVCEREGGKVVACSQMCRASKWSINSFICSLEVRQRMDGGCFALSTSCFFVLFCGVAIQTHGQLPAYSIACVTLHSSLWKIFSIKEWGYVHRVLPFSDKTEGLRHVLTLYNLITPEQWCNLLHKQCTVLNIIQL